MGESRAEGITESLLRLGLKSGRLKTGTPPRLKLNSIDIKETSIELGDKEPIPFSYKKNFKPLNTPCYSVRTNLKTHSIIKQPFQITYVFRRNKSCWTKILPINRRQNLQV